MVGWERMAKAQPNAAHRALSEMEHRGMLRLLITQNVDGLHRRAGSRNVVELHGNIGRVKCSREGTIVEHWTEASDAVPRCAGCGALLPPDVVWFEEMLPADVLQAAEDAARRCQILLVVGTSAEVYPAAALPDHAKSAGAAVVEINPHPTQLSDVADYVLRAPAGVALPALVAASWPNADR
jgi:NAD-dependent deacetylase